MKKDLSVVTNFEKLMLLIPSEKREAAEEILLEFDTYSFQNERAQYFLRISGVKSALAVATMDTFNLSFEEVISKCRLPRLVLPRQIGMTIAYKFTKLPYQSIGAIYDRDHATVMHAAKHINELRETKDSRVTFFYDQFKAKFFEIQQLQNTKPNG